MDLLASLQPWHWFALALALMTLEVISSTGFFIGFAAASLLVALIMWLLPGVTWEWQLVAFGLSSVVFTVGYFRVFKRVNLKTDSPLLNDRAAQLVGHRFTLAEDFPGSGALMINDTRWRAEAPEAITAGTDVVVHGSDGMTLLIRKQPE